MFVAHRIQNLGAIFFNVDVETAGRYSVLDQISQRAARLHDVARHPVHVDIAVVANQHALVGIDEDDPLRHVVDDHAQQGAFALADAAAQPQAKQKHGRQQANAGDEKTPILLNQKIQRDNPRARLFVADNHL